MKRRIPDPGIPKKGIIRARKTISKATRYARQFEKYRKALELFGEYVNQPKTIRKRTIESLKKRWAKIRKQTGINLNQAVKQATSSQITPAPAASPKTTSYDHTADYDNWNGYEEVADNLLTTLQELRSRYDETNQEKSKTRAHSAVDKIINQLNQLIEQYGKEAVGAAIDKGASANALLQTINVVPYGYEDDYLNNVADEIASLIDQILQQEGF